MCFEYYLDISLGEKELKRFFFILSFYVIYFFIFMDEFRIFCNVFLIFVMFFMLIVWMNGFLMKILV